MKKLVVAAFLSSIVSSVLFAHGGNSQKDTSHMTKEEMQKNHIGDHMHNGKMMNHSNPNDMTDKEMQMMKNKKDQMQNNQMNHGDMMNNQNQNNMGNDQMQNKHRMGN